MAEQNKGWFDIVKSSYVWKSMFRHEYQDTYRNRVLQVSSNVFLHLHPTKIRRHALRLRFTWCMGGITFLLFLILYKLLLLLQHLKRRRALIPSLLTVVTLVLAIAHLCGCSHTPGGQTKASTVTITATSGTLTHSLTATLNTQ